MNAALVALFACLLTQFGRREGKVMHVKAVDQSKRSFTKNCTIDEDSTNACLSLGLSKIHGRLELLNLDANRSSTNRRRTAVCIVGQLRALPIAFLNWQRGVLFEMLQVGGVALDFFVVTSKSNSYIVWEAFLEVL